MKFNLKEKLLAAKDRVTGALATGVVAIDAAAEAAIQTASGITDVAKQKVNGIKTAVVEKVETTVDTVKDTTNKKLDQLGQAIDTRANKVSDAAAEFGAAARRKLGTKQPEVVVVVAPAVVEAPVAKKTATKNKKRTVKKLNR